MPKSVAHLGFCARFGTCARALGPVVEAVVVLCPLLVPRQVPGAPLFLFAVHTERCGVVPVVIAVAGVIAAADMG